MNIAVNARFLLSGKLEGIGHFTAETMKRLTTQHPEHKFFFIFDRPFDPQFIFADNIVPVVAPPPARHPFLFYLWFEWVLPLIFKKHKINAFISTDGFLSLRSKIPSLLVLHDIAYKHHPHFVNHITLKYYEYFQPRYAQKANRIATVSAYSKNDIATQFQLPPQKIDVIYNGCIESFKPLNLEQKQAVRNQFANGIPYFLYVGSIHPRKNVRRLIEAFSLFKKRTKANTKLILAGRFAWLTSDIQTAIEQSDCNFDIIRLDYVNQNDLSRIMAAALALVYPSLFEGFGIPILEAFHTETPVITSDITSMPEVTGNAAILVNPYNAEHIATAMYQLWADESLCQLLVERGCSRRTLFTWDKTADALWQSFHQMLQSNS